MHREELLRRLDRAGLVEYQRALATVQDRAHAGRSPEEALVSAGLVSEAALARLVAESYRVPFVSLVGRAVAPEVARLVPRDVAENYALLPLEREGDVLTLAMADPLDLMAEDLVRFLTSCQIRRVMAPRTELVCALEAAYNGTPWPGAGESHQPATALEAASQGLATSLIVEGLRAGASDLHFEPRESGLAVRFRVDGRLQKSVELGLQERSQVLAELRQMADFSEADGCQPRLGRCTLKTAEIEIELAISSVPSLHGQKIVLRAVDRSKPLQDLERLGLLPEAYRQVVSLLERPSGLILVTGPTGSGKTSTGYAMLHHLGPQGRSLVALEDSWMPDQPGITCIPVGQGPGTMDMRSALEGVLLQDPDVVLLQGLPDRQTADLALRAAQEVLVITTLGAEGSLAAVESLKRLASSPWYAISNLLGVVAQRRVRRLCETCRQEVRPEYSPRATRLWHLPLPERHFEGRGCPDCSFTGYRGRAGLQEVLLLSPRLRDLFWAGAPEARLLEVALQEGLVPLAADGLTKAAVGLTSLEEVRRALPPSPGSGRSCGVCGREVREDFQVCPYCDPGLELQCPACSRPIQDDWRTCPYCRRVLGRRRDLGETREDLPALADRSVSPALGQPRSIETSVLPAVRTVLVADHDASVRAGILEALERSGYQVLLADDGRDAWETIRQESPDLVLVEVRLPRLGGLEICRLARGLGRTGPILLLHPDPDEELRRKVLDAGGDGVLSISAGSRGWLGALAEALQDRPACAPPAMVEAEPGEDASTSTP